MVFSNSHFTAAIAASLLVTSVSAVASQPAEAFLIKTRTTGNTSIYTTVPNPSLAVPDVINFNLPNQALTVGQVLSSGPNGNGNAVVETVSGAVEIIGNNLRIGQGPGNVGALGITFGDPRGIGYFAFELLNPNPTETIRFISTTGLVQEFIATSFFTQGTGFIEFFVTNNDEIIRSVEFIDSGTAANRVFNIDNIYYQAIPTPALLPGLVGMGVAALRRRRSTAA